ncbi:MAG: ABC transporter permease [Dethiobacteria bacterium]|jgi:peptide/nickel transport system permease protein|nr:ABC transporter permease [Bacillota bacterium]HOB28533.1 ABC transporter permease [Bacillota bacterium]HPZ41000.1 ABC transporter permease [Bacillota bacterium]HQD52091.1 ABC transporter permease [Bacillota bacterium]
MLNYILKRLLALIPVLIGVSILVFLILHLSPGDPAQIMLGTKATQQSLDALREQLGLDLPLHQQYFQWITNVLKGDWGRSIQLKREVLPLVLTRFKATATLAVFAGIIAITFGVLAGIVSATKQYSLWDRLLMFLALVGFCLPVFWLGLILQVIFGLKLNWLPVSGMYPPGQTGLGNMLKFLILPGFSLATASMAEIARMTRSSMLEVIRQDYIRTARAKGLPERVVIYSHALRNALIPVITVVGMQIGFLLSGAVLVEIVFGWPGIGTLMVNGILARDFPLVQGTILFVATTYVFVNLIVDIVYAFLDPRISYN